MTNQFQNTGAEFEVVSAHHQLGRLLDEAASVDDAEALNAMKAARDQLTVAIQKTEYRR